MFDLIFWTGSTGLFLFFITFQKKVMKPNPALRREKNKQLTLSKKLVLLFFCSPKAIEIFGFHLESQKNIQ